MMMMINNLNTTSLTIGYLTQSMNAWTGPRVFPLDRLQPLGARHWPSETGSAGVVSIDTWTKVQWSSWPQGPCVVSRTLVVTCSQEKVSTFQSLVTEKKWSVVQPDKIMNLSWGVLVLFNFIALLIFKLIQCDLSTKNNYLEIYWYPWLGCQKVRLAILLLLIFN